MWIIDPLLFVLALTVGVAAALYAVTVVWHTFTRPRMARRALRRYGGRR